MAAAVIASGKFLTTEQQVPFIPAAPGNKGWDWNGSGVLLLGEPHTALSARKMWFKLHSPAPRLPAAEFMLNGILSTSAPAWKSSFPCVHGIIQLGGDSWRSPGSLGGGSSWHLTTVIGNFI